MREGAIAETVSRKQDYKRETGRERGSRFERACAREMRSWVSPASLLAPRGLFVSAAHWSVV